MTEKQINEIKQYICDNIGTPFIHTKIAEKLFYNKIYVNAEFKRYTGISIGEFITRTKFEKVKEFIEQGKTVKEAFKEIGFSDTSRSYCNHKYYIYFGEKPCETKNRVEVTKNE